MVWNKNINTDAFSNSVVASLAKLSLVISSLVFFFVACGDDSDSSTKPVDAGREVATVVDMGRCTNEREGDTVYVAEKMTDYLCKNRTWVDMSTVSDNEKLLSSSSVAKVTTSATSSISSTVQGKSYAAQDAHSAALSSSADAPNSVSGISSGNGEKSAQEFIRENIFVTGVAQKGPFKLGSSINLYELKKNLNPSGRVYNDEINSNKGDFVIPKVSLAYPYAKLEITGLYRNEVTGEWSKEPMTLLALTDFSDKRTEVNINLLTHLEYDRVFYLVQEKGYSVYVAKKQVAQEIMTAFEFATAVTYSEDFAIFQNDDVGSGTIAGNGTLLAISALVMGNRSDAEIQSVINKFRKDIKTDGEWNDLQTKANMADWARDFKYSTIRDAIKSWNILDIPDYETYLDVYWNNIYGLGGCSEIRKGIVAPNSNKLSKYYNEYFVCKVDGSKYRWVSATTIEKDTYEWIAGKSGEFKNGNVTDTIYVYNGTKWEVAARETTIGVCGSKNAGVVSKFNGTYYICKSNAWGIATVLEYDTYGWKTGTEGSMKAGNVNTDKYYVYENGAWRASSGAIENNLGACVLSREGEVGKSGNSYYICKNKTWTTATALEYDTYGWNVGSEGDVKVGSVNTDKYYVYENGVWRASASEIENDLGACVISREGEVGESGNTYYICKNKVWVISPSSSSSAKISSSSSSQNAVDPSTVIKGTMTDSRDGQTYKTVKIGSQNWMAENLNYKTADSYCYSNNASNCSKYGRFYTWAAAMDSAGTWSTNGKGCGYYNKTCITIYPVRGVCPKGWHLPTITEWNTLFSAVGGKSIAGAILKSTSGWSSNGNGSDSFGFSVLPAGIREGSGFSKYGYFAYLWSADELHSGAAHDVHLNYDDESAYRSNYGKSNALSVRCLENSN